MGSRAVPLLAGTPVERGSATTTVGGAERTVSQNIRGRRAGAVPSDCFRSFSSGREGLPDGFGEIAGSGFPRHALHLLGLDQQQASV